MREGVHKGLNILAGVLGGAPVALAAFLGLDHIFKAAIPDCAPSQVDGQCGLATFLQLLYSFAGALVVWPVAAFLLSLFLLRRQSRRTAQTK
jgi:ABC-type branched-subunit amino acid transport system permease subunit